MFKGYGYPKYVSVAERKTKAAEKIKKMKKKGEVLHPVIPSNNRKIASSFWGQKWCQYLEIYKDYDNRLTRGRSYLRSGSVIHLEITQAKIHALVLGTRKYTVTIEATPLTKKQWNHLRSECSGKIGSLIELLQGKFADNIMNIITDTKQGLFPQENEITLSCSCPDWAKMCKHVVAVLYGMGVRLDDQPELLFLFRSVNHLDLIDSSSSIDGLLQTKGSSQQLQDDDLSDLFGITIESTSAVPTKKKTTKNKKSASTPTRGKIQKKKPKTITQDKAQKTTSRNKNFKK